MSLLIRIFLCVLCQLACVTNAQASDEEHRDTIGRVLLVSNQPGFNLQFPFVTQLYMQREQGLFTLSSGQN